MFTALNKAWCVNHFACSSCDQKMTVKTKFYEVDLKPVCKKCYDRQVLFTNRAEAWCYTEGRVWGEVGTFSSVGLMS